jgi:hypothetical protein
MKWYAEIEFSPSFVDDIEADTKEEAERIALERAFDYVAIEELNVYEDE